MNILYASDQYWPKISGVPVSIDIFRKSFTALGHTVSLLVPDYPEAAEYDAKMGARDLYRFRSHAPLLADENQLVLASEKKRVFALCDALQPDIIHVHTEFDLGRMVVAYARKRNIPLVLTAHTNWEELIALYLPFIPAWFSRWYCRQWMRRLYDKADTVIVPTALMEVLLRLYLVKTPIQVIPTGIDAAEFGGRRRKDDTSVAWVFEKFPEARNRRILFFAGRLGREKNITFLMRAATELLPRHPNLLLAIAGSGPAVAALREYAKGLGLGDHVLFTGFLERPRLMDFYAAADVFVSASKVESQGLVILEAMACGTPVVAIGRMGTREVMGGDFGGFMVDDDLDAFVEKTALLLADGPLHDAKSEEALRHAEKWTNEVWVAKMLRLYQSILHRR